MKKSIAIGIIFLFILSALAPLTLGYNVKISDIKEQTPLIVIRGNTLYVGGSGPGNYTKIQDAIDHASNWDTIFVYNDSAPYKENIIVDKSITIIGENKQTTIVQGSFTTKANFVNITRFNIQSGGDAVIILSSYNNISNNVINAGAKGIYLDATDEDSVRINNNINHNIINSNGDGIIFFYWMLGWAL